MWCLWLRLPKGLLAQVLIAGTTLKIDYGDFLVNA
jgi:hypothetical protein